jgi:Bcr/CflA subfamily drug resistance transporter
MISQQKISYLFPLALVFYEIVNYLSNDMYMPALPIMVEHFHITPNFAQLTMMTWFLGVVSMPIFLGPLSDRFGRRAIIFYGGIVFVLSSLFCAITSNIMVFIIARYFQGCAVCTIGTGGYASIHETYDQKDAIRILAIMGSITILAPTLGPLLGSIVLHFLNWQWIFGIITICSLIALLILWFVMPETNPPSKRHLLEWNKISRDYFNIIRNPVFVFNNLTASFTFFGMIAWIAAGSFLVITTFHYNSFWLSIFQIIIFSGIIAGSYSVKHLIDRFSADAIINIGITIILCATLLLISSVILFPQTIWGLVVSLMIFSFGSSLLFSPTARIALDASPEPMGAKMAVSLCLGNIFATLASLTASLTYNGTLTWFVIIITVSTVGACLMRWLSIRKKHSL